VSEHVGIALEGGPFDNWRQVYQLPWPPPDLLLAFQATPTDVALCPPEDALLVKMQFREAEVALYRKISGSRLTDEQLRSGPLDMIRGATYEWVDPDGDEDRP
jgi:hypothetical protein